MMTARSFYCTGWMPLAIAFVCAASAGGQQPIEIEKKQVIDRPVKVVGEVEKVELKLRRTLADPEAMFITDAMLSPSEIGGASLAQADEALRAQLDLADKTGLVVTKVRPNSPAEDAGIKQDDLLLALGETPLAIPNDAKKALKDAVDKKAKEASLKLVREGRRLVLMIDPKTLSRPAFADLLVTNIDMLPETSPYRIGVSIDEADRTLRAQMRLPAEQGLIVTEVMVGSAAEKAGIQQHDVLLSIATSPDAEAQPLSTPRDLQRIVGKSEGKPLSLTLLRGGEQQTVTVAAEKQATDFVKLKLLSDLDDTVIRLDALKVAPATAVAVRRKSKVPVETQLETITKQIEELSAAVDALRGTIEK